MKKQLLGLLAILSFYTASAQFDYYPNGRNDVPVLGMQWGLVGGGYTAMLTNRDDIAADQRLDVEMMNFNWAAGIEGIYWFQRNVGFGGQVMYWNGGSTYSGLDTFTKIKLSAKTELKYIKLPLMFYFKSYNRYYPNRRTRFNASFGPYVALLYDYSDNVKYTKTDDPDFKQYWGFTKNKYVTDGLTGTLKGDLYNPFELGFTFAVGAEVRLWRKTSIALNLRTDIGISDVENKKTMTIEYSNQTKDSTYKYFSNNYAKYVAANSLDVNLGWVPNRPATRNFSLGAFLSIRKYFGDKK